MQTSAHSTQTFAVVRVFAAREAENELARPRRRQRDQRRAGNETSGWILPR